MADPTGEGSQPKRRRLVLTEEEKNQPGLTADHVELLEASLEDLKKWNKDSVQLWAEAVLRRGRLEYEDDIVPVKDTLKRKKITGLVLADVGADVEWFRGAAGLGLEEGPARLLAMHVGFLLGPAAGEAVGPERTRLVDIALPNSTTLVKESVLRGWDGGQRHLVDRTVPANRAKQYVDAVLAARSANEGAGELICTLKDLTTNKSTAAKESEVESVDQKGWRVCATVGASGMGKSAFLETFALEQHAHEGRQALFVTFNTKSFRVPDRFWAPVGKHIQYCVSGAWLHAAGATNDDLKKLPLDVQLEDVFTYIRTKREMKNTDALVVCVDELLQVRAVGFATDFVGACMRLQDKAGGTLAMVFTAFGDPQISAWISPSGRGLYPITLHRLNPTTADAALLQEVAAKAAQDGAGGEWDCVKVWLSDPAAKKIVSVMATHPRGFFEIFVKHARKTPYVSTGSLSQLLNLVFADPDLRHFGVAAAKAVDPIIEMLRTDDWTGTPSHELVQEGLIVKDDREKWMPIPFLIRAVAFATTGRRALHKELQAIYTADMGISKQTRVLAQDVVLHFECLLRHVLQGAVTLGSIFRNGIIGDDISGTEYALCPSTSQPQIVQVPSFQDIHALQYHLALGHILLSGHVTEKGVEYLSPLFDPISGSMTAILACQVKGGTSVPTVKSKRVRQELVCEGLLEWARECGKKAVPHNVMVIPVLVMVNSTCPAASSLSAKTSVQILGSAVQSWLRILAPLQMIDEPADEPADEYEQE